jgi:hypothetical protein
MRLSDWRAAAPSKDAGGPKVAAVVDPVLSALGAGPDPHAWVAWGEEPANRYSILVPTDPGLIVCFVRVLVPGEGPRASAKLVRWARVAVGELAVEAQQGHRLLSFQVEQLVLRGVDAEADAVAAFALRLIAAIDGRPLPSVEEAAGGRGRARSTKAASAARTAAAKPSGAKTAAPKAAGTRPAGARPAGTTPTGTKTSTGPAAGGATRATRRTTTARGR